MNRTIKIGLFLLLMLPVTYDVSHAAGEAKKIAIIMFSEETRYNDSKRGIMDQLKKNGFAEPALKFSTDNAEGSKAKAAELVKKFISDKPDMIITIGTSATVAVTKEIKNVPIVFSMVYDPVDARIAERWNSSGNNTTGASPRIPMEQLLRKLKAFAPVKRLAVLYTPGERNSETQLKELQKFAITAQIRIIPAPLTKAEELEHILAGINLAADSIFLTGSSIVGKNIPKIVSSTVAARVITITHLEDLVGKGVLLGVCADPYEVGRLAGEKAAKILKGATPASIPIDTLKKFNIIINRKTADAGRFVIPAEFMNQTTKFVQ